MRILILMLGFEGLSVGSLYVGEEELTSRSLG